MAMGHSSVVGAQAVSDHPGILEPVLEPREMGVQQGLALGRRGRQVRGDACQGHVQPAEVADGPRHRHLVLAVGAVAGVRIDLGRGEQPAVAVEAQGADRQAGPPRALADAQAVVHAVSLGPAPT
jgi:hypothetical protein